MTTAMAAQELYMNILIQDVMATHNINRKIAAKLLLSLEQWTINSKNAQDELSKAPIEPKLVDIILSLAFAQPDVHQPVVYYTTLITELCRLSPKTMAPPVGKAVKCIFKQAHHLTPPVTKGAAYWFSNHLTNFGLAWSWADW